MGLTQRCSSPMLLALLLSGLPTQVDGEPVFRNVCDEEGARIPFGKGMSHYRNKKCDLAIPLLKEAAKLCPDPGKPLAFPSSRIFREQSYLPFYFLGDCHYILNQMPEALRQFYLSSCVNEPKRDNERTEDLSLKTNRCLIRLKSKERPKLNPSFSAGFSAVEQEDWKTAADKMWDSELIWEEDGKPAKSYGRWTEPYLPRFRLAEALIELGCYQEACPQLSQSKLKRIPKEKKEYEEEHRRMNELEALCKQHKRSEEDGTCRQWRCWLQQWASSL